MPQHFIRGNMGENRLSQTLIAVGVVGVVTPARHLLIDFAIIDHRHKFLEGCKLFSCEIVSFHGRHSRGTEHYSQAKIVLRRIFGSVSVLLVRRDEFNIERNSAKEVGLS